MVQRSQFTILFVIRQSEIDLNFLRKYANAIKSTIDKKIRQSYFIYSFKIIKKKLLQNLTVH